MTDEELMQDPQLIQELVDMGMAYYVYENLETPNEPTGYRLTDEGVQETEAFSNEALHPSYYKWRF